MKSKRSGWSGLIVGVSQYDLDPDIADLPAIANNLLDLPAELTDPTGAAFDPEHVKVVVNPKTEAEVMLPLVNMAIRTPDLLLVYYAGHGLLGENGQLHLALTDTLREGVDYTALPAEQLVRAVAKSIATTRILIVDCCFSGRILDTLADTTTTVTASLDIEGAVTIASAPPNQTALSPEGERYTAFTGELLEVMQTGVPSNHSDWLDIETIFGRVERRLTQKSRPKPQIVNKNQAHHVPFVRNRAAQKHVTYPSFKHFPEIAHLLRLNSVTPILGSGLSDQIIGPLDTIAQRCAEDLEVPLPQELTDSVAQLIEHLTVEYNRRFAWERLVDHLKTSLAERMRGKLSGNLAESPTAAPLGHLLSLARKVQFPSGAGDPYAMLASLPIAIYVTTQPWNFLAEALREAGREPQVEVFYHEGDKSDPGIGYRWAFDELDRDPAWQEVGWRINRPPSIFDRDKKYSPSVDHPLVYHLFGHHLFPRSLVLTEEDFDSVLVTMNGRGPSVRAMLRAFYRGHLLFLGYRSVEPGFRVLRRYIDKNLSLRPNVMFMQLDSEDGERIPTDDARRFIEASFERSRFDVYWGSGQRFLSTLRDQLHTSQD